MIVVVIVVLVVVKATGGRSSTSSAAGASRGKGVSSGQVVPASLYASYTATPTSRLASAANGYKASDLHYPQLASDPILSKSKPDILYVGAEWCPYCAAERWALVLALSKFGTFSNLHVTHSSSTDIDPNTPTWTFYGSNYTSRYVTFTPVEEADPNHRALQTPTAAQNQLFTTVGGGSYPFVYLNGKVVLTGTGFLPQRLAGLSFQQAATQIARGTSTLANAVDANAGALVSDVCHITGGAPASVCSSFPSVITH